MPSLGGRTDRASVLGQWRHRARYTKSFGVGSQLAVSVAASPSGLEMEVEDSRGFLDALGDLVGAVAGGDDPFGCRIIKMGTPIGDDAIAGVWRVAFAAVAGDRVIGNALLDGDLVDLDDEIVFRR